MGGVLKEIKRVGEVWVKTGGVSWMEEAKDGATWSKGSTSLL